MNSTSNSDRVPARRAIGATSSAIRILAGFMLLLGTASAGRAQGFVANAQISSQAGINGTYNYTIILQNNLASANSIGTFWFAWVPNVYGYDLLPSVPSKIQAPAGWSGIANNSGYYYPDGWSIEFYAASTPAALPGSTLTFKFTSTDSPATIAGTSPYLPIPASTSYIYSGLFSGATEQIVVQPAPEPSALGLLTLGAAGLLLYGWRKQPTCG